MTRRICLRLIYLSFLAGVFAATTFGFLGVVFASFVSGSIGIYYAKDKRLLYAVLMMLITLLGGLRLGTVHESAPIDDIGTLATEDGTEVTFIGYIEHFPDKRYNTTKWIVSVTDMIDEQGLAEVTGKVLVTLSERTEVAYGDELRITGRLIKPFESDEFSYQKYLAREQIFSVMNFPRIEKTGRQKHHLLYSPLYDLRVRFDLSLKKYIPAPASAFAAGILVGDRSGFSQKWEDAFRITGLSHMLALSGYNITIVILAIFFAFSWLPLRVRLGFTLLMLFFFVIFVGSGASIIRAAIMGALGMFVIHSGRQAVGGDLLLITIFIMVLWKPLILLYDPSFQLSVGGVLGMLAFATPISDYIEEKLGSRFWAELLAATIGAQLGVLPLLMYLFGEVSVISPLANAIVAPFIPPAMLVAFLSGFLGLFSEMLGHLFGFFSWNILQLSLVLIKTLAKIPHAAIAVEVSTFGFFTVTGGLLTFYLIMFRARRGA
jgi:competence protein ComEC